MVQFSFFFLAAGVDRHDAISVERLDYDCRLRSMSDGLPELVVGMVVFINWVCLEFAPELRVSEGREGR